MKGAVILLSVLVACAGPASRDVDPPLQSAELPRLDGVPRVVRPVDADYRRGSALLRGALAYDEGDAQRAATRLESARHTPDAPPSAWALHAWVLLDVAGPRAAEAVAREGLAAFPTAAGLRAVLAEALLERGVADDAERLAGPLLEERPGDRYLLELGARAAQRCGDSALALQRLDRLALAGSLDGAALRLRAQALEAVGRPAEAVPLYEQLAEQAADDPQLLEEMAFALLGAARASGEAAHFARATVPLAALVALDPQHAAAWAGLGSCYAARGLAGDAEAAWRRAMELAPADAESGLALAALLRAGGDPVAADAVLHELLRQPLRVADATAVRAALRDGAASPPDPDEGGTR